MMNSGWFLTRMVSPPTYPPKCSQNTPKKNSRKESNISIKKYHQSPTLGVKSGSSRCTPYVEAINSQDLPVRAYDVQSSQAVLAKKTPLCLIAKTLTARGALLSVARRS